MSLIVEDGTGLSNADSYLSVVDAGVLAVQYSLNLDRDAWDNTDDLIKESALRSGFLLLNGAVANKISGSRLKSKQAGEFPRRDLPGGISIPEPVRIAQVWYGISSIKGSIAGVEQHLPREFQRVKVGEIEIETSNSTPLVTIPEFVEQILRPYMVSATRFVR